MPFLTIFSAPKPFTHPHINLIQRNALASWTRLKDVDVILIGDEAGIPEAAREFGVMNVPSVGRDEKGIPLISSIMQIAHEHSRAPVLCYSNADMILMSDTITAARHTASQARDFLLVSQRWNLDIEELLDFSTDWESRLRLEVAERGKFFNPWGIDFFVFPRHLYQEVPDFTVGRVGWDNWIVYHARTSFGVAIDATPDVLAVHQNHDYSHLPGNKPSYGSEEAKLNLMKAGGRRHIYNILDTNRELVGGRIRHPQLRLVRLLRRLERLFINDRGKGWGWEISIQLQKWQKPLAVKSRRMRYARRS